MKWNKIDLIKMKDSKFNFEEVLEFDSNSFKTIERLKDLSHVKVFGEGHYESEFDQVTFNLKVEGDMILPCSISLQEVVVPFEVESTEIFSFHPVDDEDIHVCKKDWIDLNPVVFQLILSEVPLKVVKENVNYPKGDGWEVLSEEEYQKKKGNEIDPRLAKLKEFKFDE